MATQRQRLGGWLPEQEEVVARFRKEFAAHAKQRAATAKTSDVIEEFASFRMNFARAIDEALARSSRNRIR